MPDEAKLSVLGRMAATRAKATGLSAMTLVRAFRNAMAKAGDDVLNTAVGVREMSEDTIYPDELNQGLPDPALFMRLDGPEGASGLVVGCPQVVGAMIEAQTIGRVLDTAAADRRPTRTDAMLVSGFLDTALKGFAALAQGCENAPPVDGFTSGMPLPDARTAQMVLGDGALRRFQLELDFGLGAKTGKLFLIFPTERTAGISTTGGESTEWHATLENAVMGTSARMEAVLCRFKLTLAEISDLSIGSIVPLQDASLDGVSLVGSDGRRVVAARLGRSGPVRAVRLFLNGKPPRSPIAMTDASPLAAAAPLGTGMGAAAAPMDLGGMDMGGMPSAGMDAGAVDMGAMDMGAMPAAAPAPLDMGGMEPAAMEPAPMEPMAMEPMGMEPAGMDLAPQPMAMEPAGMDLAPQPLDMPAMGELPKL